MHEPSPTILSKYAQVIVNRGLGDGKGIKPGQTVLITAYEEARPLVEALIQEVHVAGGQLLSLGGPLAIDYRSRDFERAILETAAPEQLGVFHERTARAVLAEVDHRIIIQSHVGGSEGVSHERLAAQRESQSSFRELHDKEEYKGRLSWTLALYPTDLLGGSLSVSEMWSDLWTACLLDRPNPLADWRSAIRMIRRTEETLDDLHIETLRLEGEGTDLTLRIGSGRRWIDMSGRNIPSFEIFTTPDWRGTEGTIRFDQPLFLPAGVVRGVTLAFQGGEVVDFGAEEGEELLAHLLTRPGMKRVGEIGLTDRDLSPISRPFGVPLIDENVGGSVHLALGWAYPTTMPEGPLFGDPDVRKDLGYNVGEDHRDLSTRGLKVTSDPGTDRERAIFRQGAFDHKLLLWG